MTITGVWFGSSVTPQPNIVAPLKFRTKPKSLKLHASSSLFDFPLASNIMVKNLSYSTTETCLRKEFSNFCQIAEVKLVMDEKAKRLKGYAFIQYTSQDDALLALESMDHKYFDGRVIFVELAKPGHNAFGVYSKTTGPPQEQNIANQDEAMEGAGVSLFRFLFGLQSLYQAVMASYERANMGRSSSRGINVAFVWSRSYILQQQLTPPTHHLQAIFSFLPSLLLSFLQLKYKPLLVSPFETHPMTMLVSITSLIGYCFAYDAKLRFSSADHAMPDYGPIISRVMGLSGSLCLVSLASILYPDSVKVVLYLLYALFLASQFEFVRRQLQMLWNWLHQRVTSRFQQEMRMRWASINRRLWFITPANAHREGLLPLYQ